jgi:hypothetical protein
MGNTFRFIEPINANDVGMIGRSAHTRLMREQAALLSIAGHQRRHDLDGESFLRGVFENFPYLTMSPRAQLLYKQKGTESFRKFCHATCSRKNSSWNFIPGGQ